MATAQETKSTDKLLRIGILQGTKVLEERMLRMRSDVKFGSSDHSSSFVIPEATFQVTLFKWKGRGYELHFTDAMLDGSRIETADGKVSLQDLIGSRAQKRGNTYVMALTDDDKGRVRIAPDVTVLFHFVEPPPPMAIGDLPPLKRNLFGTIEPIFMAAIAVSTVIHGGLFGVVQLTEPAAVDDTAALMEVLEKITPPKVEAPKVPVATTTKVDPDKEGPGTKQVEAPSKGSGGGDGGGGGGDKKKGGSGGGGSTGIGDRTALREQLAGRGILQLIGGRSGGGGGAVGSVFGAGSSISSDVGSAIQGTAGVGIAGVGGGDGVTRRGSGGGGGGAGGGGGEGGDAVGIGDLKSSGGGKVDTGERVAAKVQGRVSSENVEGVDGTIDKKGVAGVIRRRQDAFQACYENALKANSKLQGKLVVEFTIDEQGRVSEARTVKDGLNSGEVANCVLQTMKRLRFPAPSDGEVTISNSFVFQPGG